MDVLDMLSDLWVRIGREIREHDCTVQCCNWRRRVHVATTDSFVAEE